ncbi:MAG: hypothetical protein P8Y03_18225 [Anaerolineales bacterium]|jgi:hypothetical protein
MGSQQIFCQGAVLRQDPIHSPKQLPQIVAFFVPIRRLMKRLHNGLQLLVTSQTSPVKGLAAVVVPRIPDSLTNLDLYLDQFRICQGRRAFKSLLQIGQVSRSQSTIIRFAFGNSQWGRYGAVEKKSH